MRAAIAGLGLLLALARPASAQGPVVAERGMIVSAEPHATRAGVAVLAAGGNAYDAAVAVGFALAVTHPIGGNLGGGGFCVAVEEDGDVRCLDFRETAPAAAGRDLFLGAPEGEGGRASLESARATAVPGSVAGLLHLLEKRGSLPRERVLAPAIALAREGIPVSAWLAAALESRREVLERHAATRAVFFRKKRPLLEGETLRQEDLARTLERIVRRGHEGFYEGQTAELLVSEMKRTGGLVSREDLARYRPKERDPLVFERAGVRFVCPPPPSAGGVALAQILALVEPDALRAAGRGSAEYVRLLVEAERLAFEDRHDHLGDPDFVDVPVKKLLSEEWLAKRRAALPAEGAGKSRPGVAASAGAGGETTHYCVADAEGNTVSVTTTLNQWFGTGALVPGAGFFLNNEMDDFTTRPGSPNVYGLVEGEANTIAPGKRPSSSMTPTIVTRDGAPWLVVGSPGGPTIVTTVLQIFLNVGVFGLDVREAIDAPRFHHQWMPDEILVEEGGLAPDVVAQLEALGYRIVTTPSIGRATGILRAPDGHFTGWADRRVPGLAAGP